jgi:SAM-dependent methyltransferase
MGAGETLWLYEELPAWWHLFSPPAHYVEEAADLLPDIVAAPDAPPRTLLELGAGAGSLAYHLKAKMRLTLTDRSSAMLEASKRVNPECEHIPGDMMSLNLDRTFDVVLVHDAIMYATDEAQLRSVFATAHRHLRAGGGAVFVPDCVTETFQPETTTGGEDDSNGQGLRYLEWSWDPDPNDQTFESAWAFLLREQDGSVRVESDRHHFGLFPRATWLEALRATGFDARSRLDPWGRDVFVARKTAER